MSYRIAHLRIKEAIASGFFLEAITIQESILSDRLISVIVENNFFPIKENEINKSLTLGKLLNKLKMCSVSHDLPLKILEQFNEKRNKCIHAMVKSLPGNSPISVTEFRILSIEACEEGLLAIKAIKSCQYALRKERNKILV